MLVCLLQVLTLQVSIEFLASPGPAVAAQRPAATSCETLSRRCGRCTCTPAHIVVVLPPVAGSSTTHIRGSPLPHSLPVLTTDAPARGPRVMCLQPALFYTRRHPLQQQQRHRQQLWQLCHRMAAALRSKGCCLALPRHQDANALRRQLRLLPNQDQHLQLLYQRPANRRLSIYTF